MYDIKNELPKDFDGTFRFTNWTEVDFTAKWGGIAYTFPALKTTPIVIPTATPLEIQNIRKKFAKELAEREFLKSKKAGDLNKKNENVNWQVAVTYTGGDLESLVQKCLEPLPLGQITAEKTPTESEKRPKPKATKIVKTTQSGDTEEETLVTGQGESL